MAEQRYYIMGTIRDPRALIRSRWPPPDRPDDPPFVAYSAAIDDWIRNDDVGHWVVNGDTVLTEISADQVDDVRARIRVRNRGTQALA